MMMSGYAGRPILFAANEVGGVTVLCVEALVSYRLFFVDLCSCLRLISPPRTTLIAVGLNYVGLYCEKSLSPAWGHVYVRIFLVSTIVIIRAQRYSLDCGDCIGVGDDRHVLLDSAVCAYSQAIGAAEAAVEVVCDQSCW